MDVFKIGSKNDKNRSHDKTHHNMKLIFGITEIEKIKIG